MRNLAILYRKLNKKNITTFIKYFVSDQWKYFSFKTFTASKQQAIAFIVGVYLHCMYFKLLHFLKLLDKSLKNRKYIP